MRRLSPGKAQTMEPRAPLKLYANRYPNFPTIIFVNVTFPSVLPENA